MPYAVTHMLVPMLLLDIIRDNLHKIKRAKLPNRYILLAGLGGLLPDIDIPISLLFPDFIVHRGITHTVFFPLAFLLFYLVFQTMKHDKLSKAFLMVFIGTALHIVLDFVTAGSIELFYPLSKASFSVNLLPQNQVLFSYAAFDAILLFFWFARMALRKRIEDMGFK